MIPQNRSASVGEAPETPEAPGGRGGGATISRKIV
jgi:hypothetical protein